MKQHAPLPFKIRAVQLDLTRKVETPEFIRIVSDFTLTPANTDEKEVLFDMLPSLAPLTIGDKGYICSGARLEEIQSCGTILTTSRKDNIKEKMPKKFLQWMTSTRRIVENVIGQLAERFNMERVRARDLFHLTGRLYRKPLVQTICCFMNFKRSNPILQFELLFKQRKPSYHVSIIKF